MKRKTVIQIAFLIFFAIVLVAFAVNFNGITKLLSSAMTIVSPILLGLCIAFLLDKPIAFFTNLFKKMFIGKKSKHVKGLTKLSKVFAIIVVYLLFVSIIALLLTLIVPQIGKSIAGFVANISDYSKNLLNFINDLEIKIQEIKEHFGMLPPETTPPETGGELLDTLKKDLAEFISKIPTYITTYFPQIFSFTKSFAYTIVDTVLGLAFSIYMIIGKERIFKQFKRFSLAYFPEKFNVRASQIIPLTSMTFRRFIYGRLYDSLIIGIICFVGMSIIGFQYSLLISFIIFITNIIPIFGPFIGAAISIFLLLLVDPIQAVWFALFVIVLQQLDGNVIGPKIVGDTIGLPAWWTMAAVLICGGLFGIPGVLIGVPTFAIIYRLISNDINKRLANKQPVAGLNDLRNKQ